MLEEFRVIERSLNGYPGHISAVMGIEPQKDMSEIKNSLLRDNPMVTALFFESPGWEHCKEIAEWGKKNNLMVGIDANRLSPEEIKLAIETGHVDFVRIDAGRHQDLKKKAGIIRGFGIRHEFVYRLDNGDVSKAGAAYMAVSPCDSFVIEVNTKMNDKTRDALMGLASKHKNMFLRRV